MLYKGNEPLICCCAPVQELLWSCLFLYFGVDIREEQPSSAFSFGSTWDLCQSLFPFFLLFLVMQTAVFTVSPKPKCPWSHYSPLLVLWWEYACAAGHVYEVLLLDTLRLATWWGMEANSSLSPVLSAGRYLLFCCCCFTDICLLQAQGLLEERMMWSGLWAWCSINAPSQAAGIWALLGQSSANNI